MLIFVQKNNNDRKYTCEWVDKGWSKASKENASITIFGYTKYQQKCLTRERMKTFPICKDCLGNGYVKIDTTKLTTVDNTTTCTVCTGSGHKPDPYDN